MTINTETLKQAAQNIIAERDAKIHNDMMSKRNYIKSCSDAIIKQLDAIRVIAPAFNALKTAKIKFTNDYITEGWHHYLGFSDRRNDLVGVCGGGCCGKSVFVNFENGKFVVCNWYSEHWPNVSEINIDELIENYWNDYNVRNHLNKIALGLSVFAEAVAEKITACAR